ncbi:hypothetical protein RHSIM_Rhsim06G0078500 [Rhododendron simsii]|uniref:Uncharacterized protein n=1 Tax=Rhododendron simsii TaxID=118357 RepID=A0A834GUG3_RHOSS|nr:hypothetical protein RHSIM_Rhsim06G0078500 [Rhododendron simsii]
MRYLQTTTQQQPLLPPPPQHAASASAGHSAFLFPSSPVPFGCFPSPRSPYPLLSPSLLFSPSTAGQLGFQPFPVSPRMPVTSPRWKDLRDLLLIGGLGLGTWETNSCECLGRMDMETRQDTGHGH